MAVDLTYPSVVQSRQDGNMYVPTGKSIEVESGGLFQLPVEAGSSVATLSNHGLTTFGTTAAEGLLLAQPTRTGLIKVLACTVHGATTVSTTVTAVGAKILGGSTVAAGTSVITFTSCGSLTLISATTAVWVPLGNPSANIAFS